MLTFTSGKLPPAAAPEPRREVLKFAFRQLPAEWARETSEPCWRAYWFTERTVFWRIGSQEVHPSPSEMLLIPPHTHTGRWYEKPCEHLYLHFSLGLNHHRFPDKIYRTDLTGRLKNVTEKLAALASGTNRKAFSYFDIIKLQELIYALLGSVPPDHWEAIHTKDKRILKTLRLMEEHLHVPLDNATLAGYANVSTNAFARLFARNMETPPQAYYMRLRLEKASLLLQYTSLSIETIADKCGFCDRSYFSKMFVQYRNVPPARFRKLTDV